MIKSNYPAWSRIIFLLLCTVILFSFKPGEEDPLHKRKFNVSYTEIKNDVPARKTISDLLEFKHGKVFSDFLYKKFGYKWLRYRINKDSIYTDYTNTEIRRLEGEVVITDDNNQTLYISFVSSEWDFDGFIKITKNDKLKRYYDMTGREKGGKPKKKKKKKDDSEASPETVVP